MLFVTRFESNWLLSFGPAEIAVAHVDGVQPQVVELEPRVAAACLEYQHQLSATQVGHIAQCHRRLELRVGGAAALGWYMGWATEVSGFTVAVAIGFSAAVGIFFGYYPARKAAGLNPIDAFVRSNLAKQKLTPAGEASRHTLIRRVTLDLTG